ncbi:hypothetical protein DNU06_09515 [Putridiphycobacter roseus]|uniref:Secretion system C-terminal sorting domain-containing protein n=1 Tax=Putridiphycobacter roseus TaxID=2219161 RepID=A0A2W1MXU7_9FLAO|nr:T9SS type A sorting domain-containing protein [Putridiphycobacter roseus]PZE16979.1 hypothetical protein DNU06_09515 [Putridiphycobacter roseus]
MKTVVKLNLLLIGFNLIFNGNIHAQTQIFNESFETTNNTPIINNWSSVCYTPTSGNDAAPNGGNWSLYAIGGNLQGCFPGFVSKVIPCAKNGDIIQIEGWARVDTNYDIDNLIGIGLGTLGSGAIPTLSKFDASLTALNWTYFTTIDTFSLVPGEIPVVILLPGETTSVGSCAAFFDLIKVSNLGNIYGAVSPFNLNVTVNETMLTANDTNVYYQWLNCDNNYSIIQGGTNQTYSPASNGNYAVEISNGNCIDTSACVNISAIGLGVNYSNHSTFTIYPNPTADRVNLTLGNHQKVSIKVYNINEQLIFQTDNINTTTYQFELNQPAGVYIIEVTADHKSQRYKLIKE